MRIWTPITTAFKGFRLAVIVVLFCLSLAPSAAAQQTPLDEAAVLNRQVIELYQQGRYTQAVPLAQRVLAIREKALGSEHPDVARSLNNLAELYQAQGRYAEVEPLHKRSLAIREKALGPEHPDVAQSLINLALLYQALGRHAEAEPLYKRSLAIREKALGPEHRGVAVTLNNLALLYASQGRYAEAEPLYKRSLAIRENSLGPEHADVATALNNLAALYQAQGRYAETEPLYKRSLAIREKGLGLEHPDGATLLNNLAELYQAQGRYADAAPLHKRSLAIREKALGPEHPDVAQSLINLALLYQALGRHAEAEPLYRRSLAIWEKALGLEHPDVAQPLNNLAALYRAQGRYADAEPLYKRSLAISEKALGPERPEVATALNNLAALYRAQGRYADAEPLYKRSLAIWEKALGAEHPDVALSLNNLAELYQAQGRYAETEPLYKRSLAIREKTLGLEHPDVAQSLNNLAFLYASQGRYAEAEPLYRRSLAIREKALGLEHPDVAQSLNNLALLYASQGRYADAEPLHKRSLAIQEKSLGFEHPDVAVSLNNLAALYHAQGRHADAEPLYRRSLAIWEKALGPEHPDVAQSLNNLAALYRAQGRYADAEPLYKRSLAISEKALGPEHPNVATALENFSFMAQRRGQIDQAFASIRRAVAIREKRALESAGPDQSGSEAERRDVRNSFVWFLSVAAAYASTVPEREAAVVAESFPVAQRAGQSSADRALAQAATRFASGSDVLAQAVRERQDAIGRRTLLDKAIVAATSQPPDKRDARREQATRDELLAIDRQLSEIDARLRKEFPEFAELSQPKPLALAEAQKLLAPDEALIAFVVADDAIYRFILRREKAEFRKIEIKRADLDAQVKALRDGLDPSGVGKLSDLPRFDAGQAHGLYKTLFADSVALLVGAKRLLIVPDGPLGGLPFSVLPTRPPPADAKGFAAYRRVDWLARDYAITVLPSVGSLRALRVFAARAQPPREPFLGLGDPDLKGRPGDLKGKAMAGLASRGSVADVSMIRELNELPETAEELRRIALALRADPVTSMLLRAQATEKRVRTMDLSRYRVLAFATHGLMAGEFAGYGEPALVLTPPTVGDEMDDGLLSASEVAQLKLNAEWVILSACNTAAPDGTPGAEGLSGLARAFFYAGSRALLVSHWPVLSDASVRLTTGAIENLAKEPQIGRAEALRRSMLALLDNPKLPAEYAHPAVWAPFSLVGEGGVGR